MKIIITLILLTFIICTAFNKPFALLTDYRDDYTGNYFCNRSCDVRNVQQNGSNRNTDTLTISVVKDRLDSVLLIVVGQRKHQVKLINNIMYGYPAGAHIGGKFFATDSISFGSSGLAASCSYIGKKK